MHILADNAEIAGYGEYFIKYRTRLDYRLAEFDIRRKSDTLFKPVEYVANQVNHHSVTPNINLLQQGVSCIFLFRAAHPSLSSMLELSDAKGMPMSPEEVANNYTVRLNDMEELAKQLSPEKKIAFTYDGLTKSSEVTLNSLTAFLKLNKPLQDKYQNKGFTGKWGDISPHIRKGSIVQTNSPLRNIDAVLLHDCQSKYRQTLSFFQLNPEHVPT